LKACTWSDAYEAYRPNLKCEKKTMKMKEKHNILSLLMLVHHCCLEGRNSHGEERALCWGVMVVWREVVWQCIIVVTLREGA